MKRIILRFHQGYFDGLALDNLSLDVGEALLALACFSATQEGVVGGCLRVTPAAWLASWKRAIDRARRGVDEPHEYQIVERTEDRDCMILHLECVTDKGLRASGQQRD